PIPSQQEFYFEATILNKGQNGIIGIGFCTKDANLNLMPGWENESWGYHGDDGNLFHFGIIEPYGPTFTTGDIIGCYLSFKNNTTRILYTKNGVNLGIAFQNLKCIKDLYPCIGLRSYNGDIELNFGHTKFKYD
ncbi:concanavalin A-like lectin/glucanase domain-containing protein, partial [Gigaspora rosea]